MYPFTKQYLVHIWNIHAWRPYRKRDIDKLEIIQRRPTKIIPELRDISYESNLLQCDLITLETRLLRRDRIEAFKIVKDVDRNKLCKLLLCTAPNEQFRIRLLVLREMLIPREFCISQSTLSVY